MWNLQTVEFFLREMGANLRRNPLMSLAAITTVSLSLGILGGAFLVALNLDALAQREAHKVELCAFLGAQSSAAEQDQIRRRIAALPEVIQVSFVSSEEALRRLEKQLGKELLQGLPGNQMQPSFEVKTQTLEQIIPTARAIQDLEGVLEVFCGQHIIRRLKRIVRGIQMAGLGGLILLGLATSGIINNTIRLTILARRQEIRIMQLVGATNWFIRMPFLLEGMAHGLLGSLLAIALLLGGYQRLALGVNASSFFRLVNDSILLQGFAVTLIGLGILYGMAGSLISTSRFLRDDTLRS